ncbi:MAG: RES family NAD+ phosphorylase [Hyphomicrobiales bacterium]|nr:RES family NAD+ phosphorylase [Hyphomicrobiales bacterium]
MTAPPPARVRATTHRLIASRFPTIGVFDDLAQDRDDLAVAFLLESATNDRLGNLSGRLSLLPPEEIVQGPGATLVMGAFLHADPAGGRFTDGRLGAWYASSDIKTAIAETVYHNTRRLRLSGGAFPTSIQMRALVARIDCRLVDLRGLGKKRPELYDAHRYQASQDFGTALRWPKSGTGANGITYDSVRRKGGVNVCVYKPSLIRLPVNQSDHYEYRWDAKGHVLVLKLSNVEPGTRQP